MNNTYNANSFSLLNETYNQIIKSNETSSTSSTKVFENLHNCKYCNKCYLKKKSETALLDIDIFNKINNIVFNSLSMPDVYDKMNNIILPFNRWLELNDDGLSVFHWFVWYISIKIKKYNYIKPKVYAFFQKVFSDNSVNSIFTAKQIKCIVNITDPLNPNNTLLYHLVRYCENPNDIYYKRMYQLLLDKGAKPLTNDQLNEIKQINTEEEFIPDNLKMHVSEITNKYKNIENLIVKKIETKCTDFELGKCIECSSLIDYTKEIPKIIAYAKLKGYDFLLDMIWFAYYQRKLLNKVFDNYYKIINSQSKSNHIHKRHEHVLDIYTNNLIICT